MQNCGSESWDGSGFKSVVVDYISFNCVGFSTRSVPWSLLELLFCCCFFFFFVWRTSDYGLPRRTLWALQCLHLERPKPSPSLLIHPSLLLLCNVVARHKPIPHCRSCWSPTTPIYVDPGLFWQLEVTRMVPADLDFDCLTWEGTELQLSGAATSMWGAGSVRVLSRGKSTCFWRSEIRCLFRMLWQS